MQIYDDDGQVLQVKKDTLDEVAREWVEYRTDDKKLSTDIPKTFGEFFADFGYIEHDYNVDPTTKTHTKVRQLAPYQLAFADLDYGFMLKSNKIGMTTSELLCDFWTRLLPQYAGFDCLFCASKVEIANDLLMHLKTMVNNSPKYSKYLIKAPNKMDFEEERSKVGVMYIHNPYNPRRKSRIIAIGNSTTSVYSRARVNRIHITDPSRLVLKSQNDYFAGLFSRISNTGGQIKIEGVPGKERSGWFYKMAKAFWNLNDPLEDNKSTTHIWDEAEAEFEMPPGITNTCLLYTSPSPRDRQKSRMPSSA